MEHKPHRKTKVIRCVLNNGKVVDQKTLRGMYDKVVKKFDPMNVSDQKSLNNSVLLYDEMKFNEHQILHAREGIELDKQQEFIYNISISKINY